MLPDSKHYEQLRQRQFEGFGGYSSAPGVDHGIQWSRHGLQPVQSLRTNSGS